MSEYLLTPAVIARYFPVKIYARVHSLSAPNLLQPSYVSPAVRLCLMTLQGSAIVDFCRCWHEINISVPTFMTHVHLTDNTPADP